MTFPNDHAWPGELPALRLSGHALADMGVAGEPVAFERGEDRQRTRYTINPRLASVSTLLTQAQYDRFVAFVEDELWAGARRFDVRVATEGGVRVGHSWWSAQFVGPPREVPRGRVGGGVWWEVSVELLLLDGPYASRTAPALRGEATFTTVLVAQPVLDGMLRGQATLTTTLAGRITLPVLRGHMDMVTVLLGEITPSGSEQPDGGDIARLWDGLALTPVAGDEIDRTAQQNLQRAFMEIANGIH